MGDPTQRQASYAEWAQFSLSNRQLLSSDSSCVSAEIASDNIIVSVYFKLLVDNRDQRSDSQSDTNYHPVKSKTSPYEILNVHTLIMPQFTFSSSLLLFRFASQSILQRKSELIIP